MDTKRSDTKKATPPEEELPYPRVQLKRNARCPCSSCRARVPIMDLETYRKKIETNLEMKRY
jgi:hypothetical protein